MQLNMAGDFNFTHVFNIFLLIRVVLYYGIAYLTSYSDDRVKKEEVDWNEKEEKFIKLISSLKEKNEALEKEIRDIEDSCQASNSEIRKNKLLLDLSQTLSRGLDLMTVLTTTMAKIRELLVYNSAAAFLYNTDRTELELIVHEGLYEDEMRMSLRADIAIPYIVARTGKPLHVQDTIHDPRFEAIMETAKVRSAIYVPIELEKEIFGVICVWKMEDHAFTEDEVHLLQTITREAARSIKNAELYKRLEIEKTFIENLWLASKQLTSSLDLSSSWEKVLEKVLSDTSYVFNAEKLIFFQFRKEFRELVPYIALNAVSYTHLTLPTIYSV